MVDIPHSDRGAEKRVSSSLTGGTTATALHVWQAVPKLKTIIMGFIRKTTDERPVGKNAPNAEQLKEYRECRDRRKWKAFEEEYDVFTRLFTENGKTGMTDAAGDVLVPAMYDDIVYVMHDLVRKNVVPAVLDGKMALVCQDGNGTPKTKFEYDDIYYLDRGYYVLVKDGKKGFADMYGNVYLDCTMDEILPPTGHVVPFVRDGKFGFVMVGYDVYAEPQFDECMIDREDGTIVVIKDGTRGYVDANGWFTTEKSEGIRFH